VEEDKHTSSKSGRRQRGGGVGRVGTKGGHGCVVSPESGDVDSPSTSYDGLRYVCCSVLQCVAVCCSVLQCVAVCCSALQCILRMYVCARPPDTQHTVRNVFEL